MRSYAGGGREGTAAERTGDVGAAVDVGIEVLELRCQQPSEPGPMWIYEAYHAQVVLILKASLAALAPVHPPVIVRVHVSPRILLGKERSVASLALELGTPVTVVIHVILRGILSPEFGIAYLTAPMPEGIHVLGCSMPIHKDATTRFAINRHCEVQGGGTVVGWF